MKVEFRASSVATDLVHVVDDDPAMRDSLAFLIGLGGFETRLYASGADLLARLPKPATGCVLADLRMPGIDGLELLRRLLHRDRGARCRQAWRCASPPYLACRGATACHRN